MKTQPTTAGERGPKGSRRHYSWLAHLSIQGKLGRRVVRVRIGRLEAHGRANDTVARLGGDEFAVIMDAGRNRHALAAPDHA